MLNDILKPLSSKEVDFYKSLPRNRWGHCTEFYTEFLPELEEYDLAIIGVTDSRGAGQENSCADAPSAIRKELYNLINQFDKLSIVDLGDVITGDQPTDTYSALGVVVSELLIRNVIPIILGGTHDHTYGQYLGYVQSRKSLNMVVVDEAIDIGGANDVVPDRSHLIGLLTHEPHLLKNFTLLGYQSFFTDPEAIAVLDKMNYDAYRLGEVREDMQEVEPLLREANLLSLDISAIRQSDAPGVSRATPNGFFGHEGCQISRYAGISDRLTSIGFYNYDPSNDVGQITGQLIAQMIWYFAEGYYFRKNEPLKLSEEDYLKYIMTFDDMDEMVFWKSKRSGRWWMQMMNSDKDVKVTRENLVPCSYKDYQQACNGELPERWINAADRSEEVGAS